MPGSVPVTGPRAGGGVVHLDAGDRLVVCSAPAHHVDLPVHYNGGVEPPRHRRERRQYKGGWPVKPRRRGRPTPAFGPLHRTLHLRPPAPRGGAPSRRPRASAQAPPHRGPPHAVAPRLRYLLACPVPRPPPSSSSPRTCRRSTRLFQYGGPRPGDRRGTSVASPTVARCRAMLAGSLTSASSLIRPWHLGQARTSTAKVRARSSAHGR